MNGVSSSSSSSSSSSFSSSSPPPLAAIAPLLVHWVLARCRLDLSLPLHSPRSRRLPPPSPLPTSSPTYASFASIKASRFPIFTVSNCCLRRFILCCWSSSLFFAHSSAFFMSSAALSFSGGGWGGGMVDWLGEEGESLLTTTYLWPYAGRRAGCSSRPGSRTSP